MFKFFVERANVGPNLIPTVEIMKKKKQDDNENTHCFLRTVFIVNLGVTAQLIRIRTNKNN